MNTNDSTANWIFVGANLLPQACSVDKILIVEDLRTARQYEIKE